jgi:flagellar hook-associated protein 2
MPMRISGLQTGFDTDTAIKEMMQASRMPYNSLLRKKQVFEWQRDAYRDMNTKLTDYRNNKLFKYRLESTFNANKATVTGNTSALTATPSSNATAQNLQINVTALAKAASKYSDGDIRSDATFSASQALATQSAKLNNAPTGDGIYTVTINGTAVTLDANTESLNSMLNKITSQTNVSAFFDSTTGKVSFTAKNSGLTNGSTGIDPHIEFVDDVDDAFLADVLGINIGTNNAGNSVAATDATMTLNGLATTRKSNTFEINGTTISLLQTSGGTSTTVKVGQDIDAQVATVKKFIDEYNEILGAVQSKVKEPKYRDFQPLIEEEKEAMKDSDVEKYEKKAQSGLLRNDAILKSLEMKMRNITQKAVDNGSSTYKTLSSIGIGSTNYSDNGKLAIKSEAKLRAALEAEPDKVLAIFNNVGNGDANTDDVGIVHQLYDQVKSSMDMIVKKAGTFGAFEKASSIGSQLSKLNKQILDKNNYLSNLENKLYMQFSRMERAMAEFNSQSAYLGNTINAMQGAK